MKVLFSPIGTADPLTQLGDGPMLHIVRHYEPDLIVLFLSPKMNEYEAGDQRYTRAIELLSARQQRGAGPEVRLVRSGTTEVYKFDIYIAEFEKLFSEIGKTNGGDAILANVSSGTPAMEEALVALGAFGRLNLTLLQVTTPRKGPNEKFDREDPHGYDLELLWECNPDNEDGAGCRILEVKSPNFGDRLLLENIRSLIARYDYAAAATLAKQVQTISLDARMMVEAAADRLSLNGQKSAKIFAGTDIAYSPNKLIDEYIYVLEVIFEQERWADFMRALTPAITETMLRYLRPRLPDARYLKVSSQIGNYRYNTEAIMQDPILKDIIKPRKTKPGVEQYLNNYTLYKLVDEFCQDRSIVDKLHQLFEFEHGSRNTFAHTIKRVNKADIEREGKLTMEQAMRLLLGLNGLRPSLYKRINEAVNELL